MENVSLFAVFERYTNAISHWCSLFLLLNFSEREVLAGKVLVLGAIFFHSPYFGMYIGYPFSSNLK